jgi:hypothetical protein
VAPARTSVERIHVGQQAPHGQAGQAVGSVAEQLLGRPAGTDDRTVVVDHQDGQRGPLQYQHREDVGQSLRRVGVVHRYRGTDGLVAPGHLRWHVPPSGCHG